ncbi:MAG: hypothetical protein H7330_09435 [Hymenobacteraceae bacterium]|nr:hypothetical protein [Hymenobacteraceae bacterium]
MNLLFRLAVATAFLAVPSLTAAQGIATDVATDAQRPETKPKGFKSSMGVQATLAFSGLNTGLTFELQRGRHALYAGPKISVADSYLPSQGPFGGIGGYKFYFLPDYNCVGRFGFFVNLDYQLQRYRAFNRDGGRSGQYNSLHELNLGYGLEYRFSNRWRVNNVFGFGRYWELYHNATRAAEYSQVGYNRLVRLQVLYTFN